MNTETVYGLRMDRSEIDESEFTDSELAMLDVLEEGRGTPAYLAEQIGVTQEYVRERLRELVRLGVVRKVHRGLYELNEGDGEP
jgi:predicted transcriptional regulator